MWKCPVCNTINEDNICCKNCGLDQSRNYTAYRTFYTLSSNIASAFEKEKKISTEELQKSNTRLIKEIVDAVQKLEEKSDAIKKLDDELVSMKKLSKRGQLLSSLAQYIDLATQTIKQLTDIESKEETYRTEEKHNILMASNDIDYIFGKKMDRKQIRHIYFMNSKKEICETAWDVSEKQDGSIMAWIKNEGDGFLGLSITASGNITANKNCGKLFAEYKNLENIFGMQYFQTDQTENMSNMFCRCVNLENIDVSHFDTSHVTVMNGMFFLCGRLKSIDVSHFDTSHVTDMGWMFSGCKNLESINVKHFDTSCVTDMHEMFSGCKSLESLNVSYFNTIKVENTANIFANCCKLEILEKFNK